MSQANGLSYLDPDRRRHTMYVTRNTEYHLRDGVCIAVRDRRSGCWLPSHSALRRTLGGAVCYDPSGNATASPSVARIGDAPRFGSRGSERVTTALSSAARPSRHHVAAYPAAPQAAGSQQSKDLHCSLALPGSASG
jgi:hypothetical protein